MRGIITAILLCHGTLVATFSSAQEKLPPPKIDLGFDASKVPPPDAKKGQPVARVGPIRLSRPNPLKKRGIDTAGALTHLWFYRLLTGNKDPGQDRIDAIVLWKIERELFKRYGGVVAVSKFRSAIPIDAYRRFLEDAKRTGAFEIFDPKLRQAFFEQLSEKPRFTVPPDEINFDKPW